jgi:hypothetical protein
MQKKRPRKSGFKNFGKQHKIVFTGVCGVGVMFVKKLADWVMTLSSAMDGYDPRDIANGDKTELFSPALPCKILFKR